MYIPFYLKMSKITLSNRFRLKISSSEVKKQKENFCFSCMEYVGVPNESIKFIMEISPNIFQHLSSPILRDFIDPETGGLIYFSKIPDNIFLDFKIQFAPDIFTWEVEQRDLDLARDIIKQRKKIKGFNSKKQLKKKKLVSFYVETLEQIEILSKELDTSSSSIIRLAVDEYIKARLLGQ